MRTLSLQGAEVCWIMKLVLLSLLIVTLAVAAIAFFDEGEEYLDNLPSASLSKSDSSEKPRKVARDVAPRGRDAADSKITTTKTSAKLRVEVLDYDSKNPVPGCSVALIPRRVNDRAADTRTGFLSYVKTLKNVWQTDAVGRVDLPWDEKAAIIVAYASQGLARVFIDPDEEGEITLWLFPAIRYRARFLDHEGRPVANYPVTLGRHYGWHRGEFREPYDDIFGRDQSLYVTQVSIARRILRS